MLNGATPVDKGYDRHMRDMLRDSDDDYDSDDSVSNAYESVRNNAWVSSGITANHASSPPLVRLNPPREFVSPLILATI